MRKNKLDFKKHWDFADHCEIVHCHGVFDVLHIGHIKYLEEAKRFGDQLVVSVTADRFVNKGPGRPVFSAETRAQMLASLEIVDAVVISEHPTAVPMIEMIKPKFYVKGPDYRDLTKDITKEIYNEKAAVEKHGGSLVFTGSETYSSSTLANQLFMNWSPEQQKCIARIKALGGMPYINELLEDIAKLNVLVTGEPIVDTYRFCNPENISSKSPSVSARFQYEESYAGGSLAIANHLADFVNGVDLVAGFDISPLFGQIDPRVVLHLDTLPVKMPEKIRYISTDKAQRIFEITHIDDDLWSKNSPEAFMSRIEDIAKIDNMAFVADFGHGLFEGPVLESIGNFPIFTALNVQTNSSNYGFNVFTKHKSCDYLSLDLREARLAFNDRLAGPEAINSQIAKKNPGRFHSLTLGKNGAFFGLSYAPAFSSEVIDATGAGDAYFAMTGLLAKIGAHPEVIPFVGNVFAGLKTKIVGNKSSVAKAQLVKALTAILA